MVSKLQNAKHVQPKAYRQPEHIYPLPIDTGLSILVPPVDFAPFSSLAKAPVKSDKIPTIVPLDNTTKTPTLESASNSNEFFGVLTGKHNYTSYEANFLPDCALLCELPAGVATGDTSSAVFSAMMEYLSPKVLEHPATPLPALSRNPQAYWTVRRSFGLGNANSTNNLGLDMSTMAHAMKIPSIAGGIDPILGNELKLPIEVPAPRKLAVDNATFRDAFQQWRTYIPVPSLPLGSYYSGIEVLFDDGEPNEEVQVSEGFATVVLMWTGFSKDDYPGLLLDDDLTPALSDMYPEFKVEVTNGDGKTAWDVNLTAIDFLHSLAHYVPPNKSGTVDASTSDRDLQPFSTTHGYHFVPYLTLKSSYPYKKGGNNIAKIGRYRWIGISKNNASARGAKDIPFNVGRWLVYVKFQEAIHYKSLQVPANRIAAIRLRIRCFDKAVEYQVGSLCKEKPKRRVPIPIDPSIPKPTIPQIPVAFHPDLARGT